MISVLGYNLFSQQTEQKSLRKLVTFLAYFMKFSYHYRMNLTTYTGASIMRKIATLFLTIILLVPFVATAQDDWQTYTFDDGSRLDFPSNWYLTENKDGNIELSNTEYLINREEDSGIFATSPAAGEILLLIATSRNDEGGDLNIVSPAAENISAEYMSGYLSGIYALAYQFQFAFSQSDDSPTLAIIDFTTFDLSTNNYATILSDGKNDLYVIILVENDGSELTIANLLVVIPTGEFDQHEEIILGILESITLGKSE